MIKDSFGRPALNLRVSLTQRCNLRCPYCHREGQQRRTPESTTEMSPGEIKRLVRIAVNLGLRRVKLTGGEPLLREDILDITRAIASVQNLQDLSMTTNGIKLASLAKSLRDGGLMRVNISLPSLKESVYSDLMGGNLRDVLQGVGAAVAVGLHPVKLNMLVLANINEDEIPAMILFAQKTGSVLQLIELEPVNLAKNYYERHHCSLRKTESALEKQALYVEKRQYMQNRHIYHLPDGVVEVIRPIENTEFCASCTRLRITSDGKLKPCLMINTNLVDILTPLRSGATDQELTRILMETCQAREPYYTPQLRQIAELE
jgi:cyclic pyranopterin phosphate synthase